MAPRRWLFSGRRPALVCSRAGHALVVHPKGGGSEALLRYAAERMAEPAYTVVVVDVPPDTPVEAFAQVADELGQCPGVLRLLPARSDRVSTAALGAYLAERCHRSVLAYEGRAVAVGAGGLFIPPDDGIGWMRFEAGGGPYPHSRRFPRPYWECAPLSEVRGLSHQTVLEPTPAGAWIHSAGDDGVPADMREWLVRSLLPDARLPRIVVGYPGASSVSLAAIAQLWHELPESVHPAVRFSLLGHLDDATSPFGQQLAELLDAPVVVGTGLEVLGVDGEGMAALHTLLPEGLMAWYPYVTELGYLPRRMSGGRLSAPMPIAYRPPIDGLLERGPGIYEYDDDAVLEVTQSGLWMRPQKVPGNQRSVRSAAPEPGRVHVVFDATTREIGRRMQALAHEAVTRLEPGVRAIAALLSSSAASQFGRLTPAAANANSSSWLAAFDGVRSSDTLPPLSAGPDEPGPGPIARILGELEGQEHSRILATPADPLAGSSGSRRLPDMFDVPPPPLPSEFGQVQNGDIAPPWVQADGVANADPPSSAAWERTEVAGSLAPPVQEQDTRPGSEDPVPEAEVIEYPSFALVSSPEAPPFGEDPWAGPASGQSPPATRDAQEDAQEGDGFGVRPPQPPAVPGPPSPPSPAVVPAAPPPAAPAPRPPRDSPAAPPPAIPEPAPAPVREQPEPRPEPAAAPAPPESARAAVRVQPVPSARAAAIPPDGGIDEERLWLRRNLSKQYDAAAGSISRILSEYPGLRAGARGVMTDVITDLVAVQLYLGGDTRGLDDAVRTASVGPHVPLARCVATGLRRLPSYRGATRLRVDLTDEQWQWYAGRALVTEWSFLPVLTDGMQRLPGEVEFRVWSLTARRTALLDETAADQAVFLPGTRFKVLRMDGRLWGEGSASPVVLMRELAHTEVDESGAVHQQPALDETALGVLDEAARSWDESAPASAAAKAGRFGAAPGLSSPAAGGPGPSTAALPDPSQEAITR